MIRKFGSHIRTVGTGPRPVPPGTTQPSRSSGRRERGGGASSSATPPPPPAPPAQAGESELGERDE
eukprot:7846663-Alexandrium_andersonii.AAC.1